MLDRQTVRTFVELADTLVVGFDVIELLQTLAERCVEVLGVDAAGILLTDQRGNLTLVAASTEQVRLVELFQLQNEEGPCLDCFHTGQPVTSADLGADAQPQPWPRFAAAAREQGFAAVHAFPLRLREEVLGAVNLFSHTTGALSPESADVAQALADVATIGITHERTLHQHQLVTAQLQYALNNRILIEQAKGMLAERAQISVAEAFVRIRAHARDHNEHLSAVARLVIDQDPHIAGLLHPPPAASTTG